MSHLDLEALLALREAGSEPGDAAARRHVEECPACRAELARLDQRAARLRALPALRPSRDLWPAVHARHQAERRRWRVRWTGAAGFLAAASVALALFLGDFARPQAANAEAEIAAARERSQVLETTLDRFNPEARVIDGRTARVSQELEDRIAALDQQLQEAQLREAEQAEAAQQQRMLELWRERVGLLNALVDVHLTRASNVGL
ncbi:MAG: hypothetical protein ACM3OH_07915 [Bacillota bacterium]|jgi:hypothetical protein